MQIKATNVLQTDTQNQYIINKECTVRLKICTMRFKLKLNIQWETEKMENPGNKKSATQKKKKNEAERVGER